MPAAVKRLLRPLVRILLRNGIPYKVFAEIAKKVYVDVAGGDFAIEGRKATVSRISVITGLSRKEVSRVREAGEEDDAFSAEKYNRAARVIGGWVRDAVFLGPDGEPLDLPVENGGVSFADLVRRYSGDMPTRAVLDELLRVGAVERLPGGGIRLLARAYIPRKGEAEKTAILGADVADLIGTIDHNIESTSREPRFQRKVSYDNLPAEAIPEIREMAARQGQELLELLDRCLSERDRDTNPAADGTGRMRAGVGVYYFEEKLDNEQGES